MSFFKKSRIFGTGYLVPNGISVLFRSGVVRGAELRPVLDFLRVVQERVYPLLVDYPRVPRTVYIIRLNPKDKN